VNNPPELAKVLSKLEAIRKEFARRCRSPTDRLGGSAAIEKAAKDAGLTVTVPFMPGRMDASQEQVSGAAS